MKTKYQVALVIELEADAPVDGDPETDLEGEVTPDDIDPTDPIHQILMMSVVNNVIGPALKGESGIHNDIVNQFDAAIRNLTNDHPGQFSAYVHHCVGLEDRYPPTKIV